MQQHRGRLILARSDEVYLFNRVPTFCKLVSVRGIRSIVLHLFDATTQIPLELYATVQNFIRVPNFHEKPRAPIENSKHQHFPLLPSKLNGHSPSHRRAYRYNEKDNYLFKFARWTSSSYHVLCTYRFQIYFSFDKSFVQHAWRCIFTKFLQTFEYFVKYYRVTRFIERIDSDLCRDKDYNFFVAKLATVPPVIDWRVIKVIEWMAGIAGTASEIVLATLRARYRRCKIIPSGKRRSINRGA